MAGWATLWLGGIALLGVLLTLVARSFIDITWLAGMLAALVLTPLVAWSGNRLTSRWSRMTRALNDGMLSIKDRDFSVSVTRATSDEVGELVENYNGLGERLRIERQSLYQRELMLDTVIQTTPLAMVLTNDADAVLYSNPRRASCSPRVASSRARGSRATSIARRLRCVRPSGAAATRCSHSSSAANRRSIMCRSAASC